MGGVVDHCLERRTRHRPDLDTYHIDNDRGPAVSELRRLALDVLGDACVVLTYRPTRLLTDVLFPRTGTARYLGLFQGHQQAFEYKPWVETELAQSGIQTLGWQYYADSESHLIGEAAHAQLVVRASRTDGGAGVALFDKKDEHLPSHDDAFIAASQFLAGAIPLNINACVFPDGSVTLHGPSLQLIGVPSCTQRPFGYCGNDYEAFWKLDPPIVDEFTTMSIQCGKWLCSKGYIGAFGVDALVKDGSVYLTEVNARFQGSSRCSALNDAAAGVPDLCLCHIAAHFGIYPTKPEAIATPASQASDACAAHIVVHTWGRESTQVLGLPSLDREFQVALFPANDIRLEPDAILFTILSSESITQDGYTVTEAANRAILQATHAASGTQLTLPFEPSTR
jgi:hypothetical protein